MPTLVETLTTQHRAVIELVRQLDEALTAGNRSTLADLLGKLRTGVLAHLELEDRELYPSLIAAAEAAGRTDQAALARSFSDNMLRISDGLKAFLGRHSGPTLDLEALRREWKDVAAILSQRIQSEESVLYPMHTRLTAGSASPSSRGR